MCRVPPLFQAWFQEAAVTNTLRDTSEVPRLVPPIASPYNRAVQKLSICGTGCSIADLLYTNIDFSSAAFSKYRSNAAGDGGLEPGKLVFAEEIERFSRRGIHQILSELTGATGPASLNLGGPGVVAAINAAQLLYDTDEIDVRFSGAVGTDSNGDFIRKTVESNHLSTERYKVVEGDSPVTYVLSDPHYHGGNGERTFINDIAAAWHFGPEDLGEWFFSGDLLFFGATALVPKLHDGLSELLTKAKQLDKITVVTTVYDFRNEKRDPEGRWPMGASEESYQSIDLLVTDREEALRLSGTRTLEESVDFFVDRGVGALVVTSGPEPIRYYSGGSLFSACAGELPVSEEVGRRLSGFTGQGDTTGCGDNFAGAVLAGLALQLRSGRAEVDLQTACGLGISCGGFACFYLGGTFHENTPGEKRASVEPIYEAYRRQIRKAAELLPFDRLF